MAKPTMTMQLDMPAAAGAVGYVVLVTSSDEDRSYIANATASGQSIGGITPSRAVNGLLTFPAMNPNQAEDGEDPSDDVIDDPTGTVWELSIVYPNAPNPEPVYFRAPDLPGTFSIATYTTSRPGSLPPPGLESAIDGAVGPAVDDALDGFELDGDVDGEFGATNIKPGVVDTVKIADEATTAPKLAPEIPGSVDLLVDPGPIDPAVWTQGYDLNPQAWDQLHISESGHITIADPDQGPIGSATDAAAHGCAFKDWGAWAADDVEVTGVAAMRRPGEATPLIHIVESANDFGVGLFPVWDLFPGGAPNSVWFLCCVGKDNSKLRPLATSATVLPDGSPWPDGMPARITLRSTGGIIYAYVNGRLECQAAVPAQLVGSSKHGVAVDWNQTDLGGDPRPPDFPGMVGPVTVTPMVPSDDPVGLASMGDLVAMANGLTSTTGGDKITGILGATEGTRRIGMIATGLPPVGGEVGDVVLVFDEAREYLCTVAGTPFVPGTWAAIGGGGTVDVVSNVATSRILGRTTAGSGNSEELTAAQVKSLLAITGADIAGTGSIVHAGGGTVRLHDLTGLPVVPEWGWRASGAAFDQAIVSALGFGTGPGSSAIDTFFQRAAVNTWTIGSGLIRTTTAPSTADDLTRKGYVDGLISGLSATYQPLSTQLNALAALTGTTYGRNFLELADAAAARTKLALGSLATLSTITSSEITDGTIVNADLSSSAALAFSKMAGSGTISHAGGGSVVIGDLSGLTVVPEWGWRVSGETWPRVRVNGLGVSWGDGTTGTHDNTLQRTGSGILTLGAGQLRTTAVPANDADLANKLYVDSTGAVKLASSSTTGSNASASTTETTMQSYSLAGAAVGDVYRFTARGTMVNNSAGTFNTTLLVYLGTTMLATSSVSNAVSANPKDWEYVVEFIVGPSTTSQQRVFSRLTTTTAGPLSTTLLAGTVVAGYYESTVNLGSAQSISVRATHGDASASIVTECKFYELVRIR